MQDKRQLRMRRDMNLPLKDVGPLPEGCSIHADDGSCGQVWEWIINAAFPGIKSTYAETILADKRCAPERVFFIKEYSQDIGTTAVQMEETRALVHMVGVHPVGAGRGLSKYVLHAALECIRDSGMKVAELTTDDWRLSAIKVYLELGFEPVIDGEEMEMRWKDVMKKMDGYQKKERKAIRLWPDGKVPYWQEGNCIPSLDAYPAEDSKGAVVICPGGAYCMKASHEGGQIALMLKNAGISAYVLDYRVKPCHYEAPLADAKRAIRTVRSLGYEKVAIMGFSAGGHLTCSAATQYDLGDANAEDPIERLSSRPDAFIPCYAVVSFAQFAHRGSAEALLGEHADDLRLIKRFSAELHVDGNTPPAFIWHTASDDGVPVENSLNLANALSHAGVPFEMHIFPNGPHGLGLAKGDPVVGQWSDWCVRWLNDRGFGKA